MNPINDASSTPRLDPVLSSHPEMENIALVRREVLRFIDQFFNSAEKRELQSSQNNKFSIYKQTAEQLNDTGSLLELMTKVTSEHCDKQPEGNVREMKRLDMQALQIETLNAIHQELKELPPPAAAQQHEISREKSNIDALIGGVSPKAEVSLQEQKAVLLNALLTLQQGKHNDAATAAVIQDLQRINRELDHVYKNLQLQK